MRENTPYEKWLRELDYHHYKKTGNNKFIFRLVDARILLDLFYNKYQPQTALDILLFTGYLKEIERLRGNEDDSL